MAQKDQPDEGPTLELPSLFRRKKRAPQAEAEASAADEGLAEPAAETTTQTEVLDEPVHEPAPPLTESVDAPSDVVVEPVDVLPVEEEQPVAAAPLEEQPVEATPIEDETIPEAEAVPATPKPPMRDRIEAGLPDLAAGMAAIVVGVVVG